MQEKGEGGLLTIQCHYHIIIVLLLINIIILYRTSNNNITVINPLPNSNNHRLCAACVRWFWWVSTTLIAFSGFAGELISHRCPIVSHVNIFQVHCCGSFVVLVQAGSIHATAASPARCTAYSEFNGVACIWFHRHNVIT